MTTLAPIGGSLRTRMASRPATRDDLDVVTEALTLAFVHDPVWSVALARPDGSTNHHAAFWQLYVEGSLRYSTVFMTQDGSAVSVWIPPGGTELSDAGEKAVERLVEATLEPAAARAMSQLWERFDANHPRAEPHAYLSLLATHPRHQGRGLGQRLLAQDLERWDAAGVPAYLESTNPGNDHRYERAGFGRVGAFRAVLDDAPISTMWRPWQAAAPVVETTYRGAVTWRPMALAIETERLTLRLRDERDAEWYRELVGERGEDTPTLEESTARLARFRDLTTEIGIGALAICRRAEGDAIGYCALIVGRGSLDEPEIAFELLKRFHGHGYATEAARALVDAAAATGRRRLWSTVRAWNTPSFRVLEKVGFRRDHSVTDDRGELVYLVRDL